MRFTMWFSNVHHLHSSGSIPTLLRVWHWHCLSAILKRTHYLLDGEWQCRLIPCQITFLLDLRPLDSDSLCNDVSTRPWHLSLENIPRVLKCPSLLLVGLTCLGYPLYHFVLTSSAVIIFSFLSTSLIFFPFSIVHNMEIMTLLLVLYDPSHVVHLFIENVLIFVWLLRIPCTFIICHIWFRQILLE